ncbi:hypothetical protein SLS62_003847 [Diatrype stigma]|uniref:Ketoreductase domain-containing protein n=1 Tax=Diatrype stigma TaxID=117547 RepID=A0AAN9URX9_9PEZI
MPTKTILVTGCSAGGIGAAVALALAKRAHHVFATARSVSRIPPELSRLSNVTVLPLDVTSPSSVAQAAQAVAASGRQLDVLVNNAGVGHTMPILDLDVDAAKRTYDINVFGVIRMVQAFADMLIQSKGRVVNLSTCGAASNSPWFSPYTSSKAALTTTSETLRLELSPFGVSVVTIMTGIVNTHFHANEPDFILPEGSRYEPIKEIVTSWATGESKPSGGSAEQFAESILGDIVGDGKGGVVWRGRYAGSTRFFVNWLPTWCQDLGAYLGYGLKELAQKTAAK